MQTQVHTKETERNDGFCNGIHELIDWQIIQYRRAVDEHRRDLSKLEGRCVAWQEAEKDFNADDQDSMGEKSRVEYCGLMCPMRTNCLTALHFLRDKQVEPLAQAG